MASKENRHEKHNKEEENQEQKTTNFVHTLVIACKCVLCKDVYQRNKKKLYRKDKSINASWNSKIDLLESI